MCKMWHVFCYSDYKTVYLKSWIWESFGFEHDNYLSAPPQIYKFFSLHSNFLWKTDFGYIQYMKNEKCPLPWKD